MKCRSCSSKNTKVTVTEGKDNVTWRYCRCLDCGSKFKTIERYAVAKKTPFKPNPRRGCSHVKSYLTADNIRWIRNQHEAGITNAEIADELKLDRTMISKIVNYKTYKDVV